MWRERLIAYKLLPWCHDTRYVSMNDKKVPKIVEEKDGCDYLGLSTKDREKKKRMIEYATSEGALRSNENIYIRSSFIYSYAIGYWIKHDSRFYCLIYRKTFKSIKYCSLFNIQTDSH